MDDEMEALSGAHFSGWHPSTPSSSSPTPSPSLSHPPFVIGVSGGTASGKTTVCDMIIQQLQDHRVVLVSQDSFYRGLTNEELKRGHEYNFDHPDAFDTEQLVETLSQLKSGQSVQVPIYDFKLHQRSSDTFRQVNASEVIILEGILVFHEQRVRNMMDMKIFVDADPDVRLARRIRRDTVDRGRDVLSVLEQYAKFVKPAFDDFILPSKKYADVIIPRGGDNHVAIDLIVQHIRTKLGQHNLCKIYPNLNVIQSTFQARGMHTLIRDKEISKHDFVFYSNRLIRLVVEHGLGYLPFTEKQVITPTGSIYIGVDFCKKLCGVSVIRSGESMENALRECCKGIKIGKILIHREGDETQLIYEKLPKDIAERHVLLMDPVLGTGNTASQAIELLIKKGCPESRIIFLNLISAPEGIHCVCKRFPQLKIAMHIVFVHYLEVKGNKSNIGGNTNSDGVISDSQVNSPSSGFPASYSSVPSLSTEAMSPTSSLTSLREDADSGDHGQSSISGTDYIPLFDGDKFRGNDTTYIDGLKGHGIASWDNVLQCTTELNTDPSLVSFPSILSGSMRNILEQEHNILDDLLMSKSGPSDEAGSSQSLQSNWQIPFEGNVGHIQALTQSLSSEFGSDYGSGLLRNEAHNGSSEVFSVLSHFHGQPKQQLMQQNYPEQHFEGQPQHALTSDSANRVPGEETINYPLTVRRTLLDRDESLKKVDSFSRWITKELGEVDDLNMQSSPGISWSTDECGHVLDDTSLSPSISQDQLFSINDFSPKWAYAESEIEVLIIGSFLMSQPEVRTSNWSCMFGEVEVHAEVLSNGILCCQAPHHKVGRVPFYVTCSNRLACSEVREFDYREGFSRKVGIEDFFNSSTDMLLHLRLEELLSLMPVHPPNQTFEGDVEKRNLIFNLISLREEEEFSTKEELTVEMDISQQKEHLFCRQVKEKLYSWLLHKVTEGGKGPNVLDNDGQGALHLAAVLGYDWAITPILTAGVNINFRDVNGWTALHWAASCGRERTVAFLVSMGADSGALTDPSPAFPLGRTAADLASSNGHKGISGFLAESSLTSHLESLTMDDQLKGGRQEISGMKAVQTVSERTPTPVLYNDMPDALCLKDSLTAVRNATQAADRIHQVFRMQSFQRKQLTQTEDGEFDLLDQQALSLLASKASKSGLGDGLANAAAVQIQKKFRGWKKRKEFLIIRQRIVKIQAHVRGHQVRKQYKTVIWSVGILEKVILRWRRKGSGLRGFRPDAVNKVPCLQQNDSQKEDEYDYLKEGRKQSEEKIQKALSRVKSMVQYPEARAQYRRLLNVVDDFRQKKASNMDLIHSEETVDGMEDLIDIDMLLDDDNFIPIAFD